MIKGGILLAAYGVRRPTKDADANAIGAPVTAEHLSGVVHDIAAVEVDDGVAFDLESISIQRIREQVDYPGFRVRVCVSIGPWRGNAAWDVSAGDPIVPAPRQVRIARVLGEPIELLGYAPETTIAEKWVTILERGITSTRWRDYVDIVLLARQGINTEDLLRSARAVARYRGVTLAPIAPQVVGYGQDWPSQVGRMATQGTTGGGLQRRPRRTDDTGGLLSGPRVQPREHPSASHLAPPRDQDLHGQAGFSSAPDPLHPRLLRDGTFRPTATVRPRLGATRPPGLHLRVRVTVPDYELRDSIPYCAKLAPLADRSGGPPKGFK